MFNPQGAYPQPPWQQNFQQPPHRTGPPPAKRQKNNPIITRYPPPPGYRGPAQPQAPPFQQPTPWTNTAHPFVYGQKDQSMHPQPGYGPPQTYQQAHFAGYQPHGPLPNSAYAALGFPQNPVAFSPPPSISQLHNWPQSAQGSPPQPWNPSHAAGQQTKQRHYSAPSLPARSTSFGSFDGQSEPASANDASAEDVEDDFYAECYFATHPEEIDPNFSLGMIEWKAPLPIKRPLPSTFAEAELEALAPRKPRPTDDESISDYFIKSKRHEAFLSVRLTEYWEEVKHDIIFKEFPVVCARLLSMSELLARYKDRPDPAWSARVYSPTPDPESFSDVGSESAMEVDDAKGHSYHASEGADVLGSLNRANRQNGANNSRRHSRASSVASNSSQRSYKVSRPKPKALIPIRDQAQEDVLAALGVTGSPKLVYQTPGPAIGPPAPQHQRNGSRPHGSRHSSANSNGNIGAGQTPVSSTSARPGQDVPMHERRGSNTSQHTAMGSDFEDNEATPRAKITNSDKRKRTRQDSEDEASSHYARHEDQDATPKPRRKQHRVDDPYR